MQINLTSILLDGLILFNRSQQAFFTIQVYKTSEVYENDLYIYTYYIDTFKTNIEKKERQTKKGRKQVKLAKECVMTARKYISNSRGCFMSFVKQLSVKPREINFRD
jgi:hypothetical protein